MLLAAGSIYAFIHGREAPEQIAATTAANANAYELAQRALDRVKPGKPRWDYIEVDKDTTAKSYHLTLFYNWPGPDEEEEPEWDTKRIARAVLAELLASGAKPMEEQIIVIVQAWRRTKGETGKDLGVFYGVTSYRASDDQLHFQRKVGLF